MEESQNAFSGDVASSEITDDVVLKTGQKRDASIDDFFEQPCIKRQKVAHNSNNSEEDKIESVDVQNEEIEDSGHAHSKKEPSAEISEKRVELKNCSSEEIQQNETSVGEISSKNLESETENSEVTDNKELLQGVSTKTKVEEVMPNSNYSEQKTLEEQSNEPIGSLDHASVEYELVADNTKKIVEENECDKIKNVDLENCNSAEGQRTTIYEKNGSSSTEQICSKDEQSVNTDSKPKIEETDVCENSELKSSPEENLLKEDEYGKNESECSVHLTEDSTSKDENNVNYKSTQNENIKTDEKTVAPVEPSPQEPALENSPAEETEAKNDAVEENELEYKKSEPNNDLLAEILNHQFASYWQATSHNPYVLNPVAEDTNEFKEVLAIFSPTCRNLKIKKLERIENPYLLALYLNKKEKLRQKNSRVEEISLFHGTNESNVDGICKNNFDWRLRGSFRGHKFGQGVSFAPEVSYAFHYGRSNLMILTKVLVAKKMVGGSGTVIPPEPYDTTTNSPETVFVKYEDDDFLPQYVIHYE